MFMPSYAVNAMSKSHKKQVVHTTATVLTDQNAGIEMTSMGSQGSNHPPVQMQPVQSLGAPTIPRP